MIGVAARLDTRGLARSVRRLSERTRRATAQELNTQRRQSRTRMVRGLSKALGVKPMKRIRRRMLLPRGGNATPRRLVASGLSLVEVMPGRWFARGRRGRGGGFTLQIPSGAREIRRGPVAGDPFRVQTGPVLNVFRRKGAARLPIVRVDVDTSAVGYAVRARVLEGLAREWPARWDARLQREIRRTFGA